MATTQNKLDAVSKGKTGEKRKSGNAFIRFLASGGFVIFIILGLVLVVALMTIFKW